MASRLSKGTKDFARKVRAKVATYGRDVNEVVPNTREEDFEGRVVVLVREQLTEPYASGDRRFIAKGGLGTKPKFHREQIVGRYVQDGLTAAIARSIVEGIAVVQEYAQFPAELNY